MIRENPRRLLVLLSMLGLIGYGALLFTYAATGVGGSDSSGYANTARDLLAGRLVIPIAALDRLDLPDRLAPVFRPLAHVEGPSPRTMVPFYPPGFPLHVAAFSFLAGFDAGPYVVTPVLALVALFLMFLLGRELSLSRPLAFTGAAILAACPIFLFQAVLPMSDVAATAWSIAAVLCALRTRRKPTWALLAGAVFGMAVLVRPSIALLLVPVACALAWSPGVFAMFAAGGLPFAAFLGFWNQRAYGSPLRTGYSPLMGDELRSSHFAPRFVFYGARLAIQLSPLPSIGWLTSLFSRSLAVRDRALLGTWFGLFFVFYCFWGPADNWTYTRFLLPALPALILGFLVALRDCLRVLLTRSAEAPETARHRRALVSLAAAAILLVVFGFELKMDLDAPRPYKMARGQAVFPEACRALSARAPDGKALVVSMEFSGAVRFYTDMLPLRWDAITAQDFALVRARAAEKGYRILAVFFPQEVPEAAKHVPGRWSFLGQVRSASLWELEPAP